MEEPKTEQQNLCSGCAISYSESKEYSCERVFDFLLKHGVLTNSLKCPNCGGNAKLTECRRILRCHRYRKEKRKKSDCDFSRFVRHGTFLHQSKLPESSFFRLVSAVLWLLPPRNTVILQDGTIKEHHLIDCFLSLREVFIDAVSTNSKKLGGKNQLVELAEAKWKSDNVKGGLWDWAFGAIEHKSGETFLAPVEHHNLESLKKIISEKINPGTIIVTSCTNSFTSEELEDLQKNLRVSFILPADSSISAVIKHHWAEVRKGFINLSSKRPPNSIDQLAEYLFKSKHPILADRIHAFFVAAGMLYPPGK